MNFSCRRIDLMGIRRYSFDVRRGGNSYETFAWRRFVDTDRDFFVELFVQLEETIFARTIPRQTDRSELDGILGDFSRSNDRLAL